MKAFPRISKTFSRIAKGDRLRERTVKAIAAALFVAGMAIAAGNAASATEADGPIAAKASSSGGVIVLTPPPSILIDDGRTLVAGHYSHSSHASHASHASHCSGYSWCG